MTTKELIQQYVTAHSDNRWMDASELEALLTEFAEKLKEPANESLKEELERFIASGEATTKVNSGRFQTTHIDPLKIAKHFAEWQREQMMKGAIDTRIDKRLADMIGYTGSERVKVIIIKE